MLSKFAGESGSTHLTPWWNIHCVIWVVRIKVGAHRILAATWKDLKWAKTGMKTLCYLFLTYRTRHAGKFQLCSESRGNMWGPRRRGRDHSWELYGNKIVCTNVFDWMNKKLHRDWQDGLGLFSVTLQRYSILWNFPAIVPWGLGGLSTASFLF